MTRAARTPGPPPATASEELGQLVAQRLAAILGPALDDIRAKTGTILAGIEELRAKLLLIEQHYQTCPQAQADKGTQ
jgi:hypothetical protein